MTRMFERSLSECYKVLIRDTPDHPWRLMMSYESLNQAYAKVARIAHVWSGECVDVLPENAPVYRNGLPLWRDEPR